MVDGHETELQQAILDAPDDDAPRWALADWLDEQGDADRAEFIRVQIDLHRGGFPEGQLTAMRKRSADLEQALGVAWIRKLPDLMGVHWEVFERGLISTVRFDDPSVFQAHAEQVFASAPIREVRFHRWTARDAERSAQSPFLNKVQHLDFEDGNLIGNAGLEAIAESPYLNGVRTLRLRGNGIGVSAGRVLAEASGLRSLRNLDLCRNLITDEGVNALTRGPGLSQLTHLLLGWTEIGDSAMTALADSPVLSRMMYLYVSGNHIGDDGLSAFVRSPNCAPLRVLFMEHNLVSDRGIRALARSEHLRKLEYLFLRRNRITSPGALELVESGGMEHIAELVLGENAIDSATHALRARFGNRVIVH